MSFLWRKTLGLSLGTHDAVEPIRGMSNLVHKDRAELPHSQLGTDPRFGGSVPYNNVQFTEEDTFAFYLRGTGEKGNSGLRMDVTTEVATQEQGATP